MQIVISLDVETPIHLPFSYYPDMAAALYQALAAADPALATDLHEGAAHRNRIKLFAFSPLHSRTCEVHPQDIAARKEGGLLFKGPSFFKLCSPWPELMNRIGEGLLAKREFRIGSQLLRVVSVRLAVPPQFTESMAWRPTKTGSVVTSWSPKGRDTKLFAFPGRPADGQASEALLRTNLVHKWRRLCEIRGDIASAWSGLGPEAIRDAFSVDHIAICFGLSEAGDRKAFRTRLHHLKGVPVRSWQATVAVTAPVPVQRLIWSCGLGEMNSMGFGLAEEAPSCC